MILVLFASVFIPFAAEQKQLGSSSRAAVGKVGMDVLMKFGDFR